MICISLVLFQTCGIRHFMIACKVCSIKKFHLVGKVCYLLSIGIRPVHITSSKVSYTQHIFQILSAPLGFIPFVESFVTKVF